jgi:peptidoglycan/xylan/chitin deacetylase (PgdA/CDA1 family)
MSSVTFDDGLASLYTHAWPVLEQHRIPATIFLVAKTLTPEGKAVDWIDNPPAHKLETLALDQILEMQDGGIEFGSHSHAHADLTGLSEKECEQDLRSSRELLADLLGRPVTLLAYPRGLHNEMVHRAARRAGFEFGFGTSKPPPNRGSLAIPRVGVYPSNGLISLQIKSSRWYPAIRTSRALGRLRGSGTKGEGRAGPRQSDAAP